MPEERGDSNVTRPGAATTRSSGTVPGDAPVDDGPPETGVFTITGLEQLRVLADPLRARILESFAERARTTKQVAERLGEPTTKLYHHVDALERAGLIELRATRPNRGTLEKYYRAVARAFRADPELLPGTLPAGDLARFGADLLEETAQELRRIGSRHEATDPLATPRMVRADIRATTEEIAEIDERLERFLEELGLGTEGSEEKAEELGDERYRLVIAFYPLER